MSSIYALLDADGDIRYIGALMERNKPIFAGKDYDTFVRVMDEGALGRLRNAT